MDRKQIISSKGYWEALLESYEEKSINREDLLDNMVKGIKEALDLSQTEKVKLSLQGIHFYIENLDYSRNQTTTELANDIQWKIEREISSLQPE